MHKHLQGTFAGMSHTFLASAVFGCCRQKLYDERISALCDDVPVVANENNSSIGKLLSRSVSRYRCCGDMLDSCLSYKTLADGAS